MADMRIRHFRPQDRGDIYRIFHQAVQVDMTQDMDEQDFSSWLLDPELDALSNAFVVTDEDEDEDMMEWSQAGNLEGIEGEIIGFTVVESYQNQEGYHLCCHGTVHPFHRHKNAGRSLLICALNQAHLLAADLEYGASAGQPAIYFEAMLPRHDPGSSHLAQKSGMVLVTTSSTDSLQLYRAIL